jgi:hypothetical protein
LRLIAEPEPPRREKKRERERDLKREKEQRTTNRRERERAGARGWEGGPAARHASLRRDSENLRDEQTAPAPAATSSPRLDGRGTNTSGKGGWKGRRNCDRGSPTGAWSGMKSSKVSGSGSEGGGSRGGGLSALARAFPAPSGGKATPAAHHRAEPVRDLVRGVLPGVEPRDVILVQPAAHVDGGHVQQCAIAHARVVDVPPHIPCDRFVHDDLGEQLWLLVVGGIGDRPSRVRGRGKTGAFGSRPSGRDGRTDLGWRRSIQSGDGRGGTLGSGSRGRNVLSVLGTLSVGGRPLTLPRWISEDGDARR